jgi:hypothetical protein
MGDNVGFCDLSGLPRVQAERVKASTTPMSFELVNTLATCATFVVIAITAIAAVVQLRHLRASNQITAFTELRASFESENLAAAHKYVDTQLQRDLEDPAFRYAIGNRSVRTEETHERVKHLLTFGHFFDGIGLLVKFNFVPSELVLASWSDIIVWCWQQMSPVIANATIIMGMAAATASKAKARIANHQPIKMATIQSVTLCAPMCGACAW